MTIIKKINSYVKSKDYYNALNTLRVNVNTLPADSYNSALMQVLFALSISLGVQGAYLTKKTYDVLTNMPSYKIGSRSQCTFFNKTLELYSNKK